ncbi:hypothetical protein BDR06DRAFT_212048 [Suillus hirtellus]|nr:hypothetical protein BDR06DRAFT_212048 [Suillus hirtellus]
MGSFLPCLVWFMSNITYITSDIGCLDLIPYHQPRADLSSLGVSTDTQTLGVKVLSGGSRLIGTSLKSPLRSIRY